jgi:hypothetical protein
VWHGIYYLGYGIFIPAMAMISFVVACIYLYAGLRDDRGWAGPINVSRICEAAISNQVRLVWYGG